MAEPALLLDLGVVFLVAAVTTVVFHRLRQPVVLGYIVAGIIVGPATPPSGLLTSVENIHAISEIGLVFFLFAIGLEWSIGAVRRLGGGILAATPIEVGITMAAGFVLGRAIGWTNTEAFLLGAALSISSTVIIMRNLTDQGNLGAGFGRSALGINIVEDLIAITLISVISGFAVTGTPNVGGALSTLGGLALFVAVTVVVGYVVVPRLVGHIAGMHISDVLVVALVGLAFGLALLAEALGFAAAFGAFLAGFLITGSDRLHEVRERIEPLRDVFGAVFFVSIGTLVDPALILQAWPVVLAAAVGLVLFKPLAVVVGLVLVGRGGEHATRTGLHLVPIGEMGFVIAGIAGTAGLAPDLLSVVTGAALLTTLASPYIARHSARIARALDRVTPRPLRAWSRQYAAWAGRFGHKAMPNPDYRREVRRRIWRATVNGVIIVGLFAGAALVRRLLVDDVARLVGTAPVDLVLFGTAAVLAVPAVVLMVRNLREAGDLVVSGMMPTRLGDAASRPTVARVVRDVVVTAVLLLVGAVLVLTVIPVAPDLPVLVAVGLILLGAAAASFDAVMAVHRRVQDTVERAFLEDVPQRQKRELEELLVSQYPWGVVFEDAVIGPGSRLTGRPLSELRVPEHTGATIVSLRRGDDVIVNPGPSTMLVPGDQVLLAGEPSQVVRARDLLAGARDHTRRLDAVGATTLEVQVAAGSAVAGRTMRQADLRRRTGATVLGVVREGRIASHPDPGTVLAPGDRLLLFGTDEQVERAARLVRGEEAGAT